MSKLQNLRDGLSAYNDRPFIKINMPEWSEVMQEAGVEQLYVRALSVAEADQFRVWQLQNPSAAADGRLTAKLASLLLFDDRHHRVFVNEKQVADLAGMNKDIVERIIGRAAATSALDFAPINDDDLEDVPDAVKN